ncbi:MAG: DUF5916 domain-containing protein [Candidatus Aminicenantes bacterium]
MRRKRKQRYQIFVKAVIFLFFVFMPFSYASGYKQRDKSIQAGHSIRALWVNSPPKLDGYLDEEIWENAAVAENFIQRQPNTGEAASEKTEVRILFDHENIYFGIKCFDSEPNKIIANVKRRDSEKLVDNDHFEIMLDTFYDKRNGYIFIINPIGAKSDLQIRKEGRREGGSRNDNPNVNKSWDAVWEVETSINERGWFAEVKIPLYNFRFKSGAGSTWGLNFLRNIRRKNEASTWVPLPRNLKLTKVSISGPLYFAEELNKSLNFHVKPYIYGGKLIQRNENEFLDVNNSFDMGVDLKYGLASGLTLELTGNTDFSHVEADNQQINLTRFDLYYPEKREFFLDNQALFSIGSPEDSMIFFSRQIGISEEREEIPLLGGAKIAGRLGSFNLGLLSLQSQKKGMVSSNNYSVFRLSKDVLKNSAVGFMMTNRQSGIFNDYNRAFAFDGDFHFGQDLSVNGYYSLTDSPHTEGKNSAKKFAVTWISDSLEFRGHYFDIQDNFNAEMGFYKRTGIRELQALFGYTPEPDLPGVRRLNPHINITYIEDHNRQILERNYHSHMMVQFINGGHIGFQWNDKYEFVDQTFNIQESISIPIGYYKLRYWEADYQSDKSRNIYGEIKYRYGGFYGGNGKMVNLITGFRPFSNFYSEFNIIYNDIDLPQGAFVNHLLRNRLIFSFSKKLVLMSLIQWNSDIDELNMNIRLHFIYKPGSHIYVVYNEQSMVNDLSPGMMERALAIKVNHLFNF